MQTQLVGNKKIWVHVFLLVFQLQTFTSAEKCHKKSAPSETSFNLEMELSQRIDCNNNASSKLGWSSPYRPLLTEDLVTFFRPRKFRMRPTNLCPTAARITPSHSRGIYFECAWLDYRLLLSRWEIHKIRESRALTAIPKFWLRSH